MIYIKPFWWCSDIVYYNEIILLMEICSILYNISTVMTVALTFFSSSFFFFIYCISLTSYLKNYFIPTPILHTNTFALHFSRSIYFLIWIKQPDAGSHGINGSLCMDFNRLSIWNGNIKSLWVLYKSGTLKSIFCLLPMLRISNQWSLSADITILIRFLL